MAKQNGLGMRFLVGGYNVSGDISAIDQIGGGPALLDGTDITMSAKARIGSLRDGKLAFTSFMDVTDAHPVLSALPTADTLMTALFPALAVGAAAACLNAKQVNYDPTRGTDGSLLLKVDGEGNAYGLEWGQALTAGLRTDTAATNGASLDGTAGTAYGAQAYLQLTSFTGTSVDIVVQHSTDNSTWATLLDFGSLTAAPATSRQATANTATVDRYLRVITTGTFTSATFTVVVNRNEVAGVTF